MVFSPKQAEAATTFPLATLDGTKLDGAIAVSLFCGRLCSGVAAEGEGNTPAPHTGATRGSTMLVVGIVDASALPHETKQTAVYPYCGNPAGNTPAPSVP
jgi:hypothetical protein